jgi:hypothetical protein
MNYYTYTIHFVDGYYYHGYHKHEGVDPLTDGYYGSPVTHKEKWLTTMHWEEITGLYETRDEVTFAEKEAIRPVFSTDPYCLNANCNGIPTREQAVKGARKAGKKAGEDAKKNKTRVCDPVNQEKGRQTARERGVGFHDSEFQHSPEMVEMRKRNGKKVGSQAAVNGQLAAARAKVDPEKRRLAVAETGRIVGRRNAESGHMDRIRALVDPQVARDNAYKNLEKMNKGRWRCLVTGHESSYAGLSKYQNRRGIDKSLREQVG